MTKHLERYPLAPGQAQLNAYHGAQLVQSLDLGLQYRTGPRYGQQLAGALRSRR